MCSVITFRLVRQNLGSIHRLTQGFAGCGGGIGIRDKRSVNYLHLEFDFVLCMELTSQAAFKLSSIQALSHKEQRPGSLYVQQNISSKSMAGLYSGYINCSIFWPKDVTSWNLNMFAI